MTTCANHTCSNVRRAAEGSEYYNAFLKAVLWVCPTHVAERNAKIMKDKTFC